MGEGHRVALRTRCRNRASRARARLRRRAIDQRAAAPRRTLWYQRSAPYQRGRVRSRQGRRAQRREYQRFRVSLRGDRDAPAQSVALMLQERPSMKPFDRPLLCLAAALLLPATPLCRAAVVSYDLILRNGRVIDGTGSPWYAADIAVKDGRIAAVGRLAGASATRNIDAHGMVVAPGFIDML